MSGSRALAPHMVGRQAQLAALEEHLQQARAGSGRLVFLAGEAGIGKTCLVRTFLARARDIPGTEVLLGHCYEEDPPVPYGPFLDALRDYLRRDGPEAIVQAAGPFAGDLAALLPELPHSARLPNREIGSPTPVRGPNSESGASDSTIGPDQEMVSRTPTQMPGIGGDPHSQKRRLFTAISRVLRPSIGGQCLVLVLEDLHWIDATSQELLQYVARTVEHERLLILGTFRSDELLRWRPLAQLVTGLTRTQRYYEVGLARLTAPELSDLLHATLGRAVPAWFVEALAEAAGSNPFFVEEILRSFLETAQLEPLLQATGRGRESRLPTIPRSVKAGIRGRMADLDESTAEVLRYAAVIGRRFNFELLLRLTGLEEAALVRDVARLVGLQLVVEDRDGVEDQYSFRHALTREAIYDDLLGRDRRLRHRAVLRVLEELDPVRGDTLLELLAYHSRHANEREKAAHYARLAGDRSAAMYAFREAMAQYGNALELIAGDDAREQATLLERLAEAAFPLADTDVYEPCWREALRLYVGIGDRLKVADLSCKLGLCAKDRSDHAAAVAHYQAALAILEAEPPGRQLAGVYSALQNLSCNDGQPHRCLEWGEKLLHLAEALGDPQVYSWPWLEMGRSLRDLGEADRAVEYIERGLALARQEGEVQEILSHYMHLGWTHAAAGAYGRAVAVYREGLALADRHGRRTRMSGDCQYLGYAEMELGHWDLALAALDSASSAAEQGHPFAHLWAIPGKGELLLRLLEGIMPACEAKRGLHLEPWPALARVRMALADTAGALAAIDTMLHRWREQGAPAAHEHLLSTAVDVYLAGGRREAAVAVLDQLARFVQRPATLAARVYFAEAWGQLAAHEGRHAVAAAHFEDVAALWHEMDATYREARARRLRAESLLQLGDASHREEAANELATAQAICTSLGASLELEAIGAVTQRYAPAAEATREARSPDSGLSRREREVIGLIARGHSNRAIADALVISERTVEHHVSSILGKLGCTSRTQAAAYAVAHELAAPPSI